MEPPSSTVADGSTTDDGTVRLANDIEDIDPTLTVCVLQLMKKMCWLEMEQSGYLAHARGRLLHKDCAEESVVDKDLGNICIDILSVHA